MLRFGGVGSHRESSLNISIPTLSLVVRCELICNYYFIIYDFESWFGSICTSTGSFLTGNFSPKKSIYNKRTN